MIFGASFFHVTVPPFTLGAWVPSAFVQKSEAGLFTRNVTRRGKLFCRNFDIAECTV